MSMSEATVPRAPASDAGSKVSSTLELFSDVDSDTDTEPQVVTPDLLAALLRQVEFYLSDANLPTDKKLLKLVRKDPAGYVPVKLFVNFRKIRALTKDPEVVALALRDSKELTLSADEKSVKRVVPVPEYNIAGIQRRTVIVENMPSALTIEDVTHMFVPFGAIKVVRICAKDGKSKLPGWLTTMRHQPTLPHAFIEYEEELAAENAEIYGNTDKHELRVTRLTSLLQHLYIGRDDSLSRRGSSKGSSLRSSRDPSPSAHYPGRGSGYGGSVMSARAGAGSTRAPSSCLSRSPSIASSTNSFPMFDAHGRRISNSSGSGSSNGGGGPASGARSFPGSMGGAGPESASWVHVGTPPAAPSFLRRSDSDKSSSGGSAGGGGPWASVCPAAPAVPALGVSSGSASLQLMPTLADGIISSQLSAEDGSKAAVPPPAAYAALPPKAGVYVPPARRSADGRSSGGVSSASGTISPIQTRASAGGSAAAAVPDLAAAAARSLSPNLTQAAAGEAAGAAQGRGSVDSPALAPSSPMRQHPAPVIPMQPSGGPPAAVLSRLVLPSAAATMEDTPAPNGSVSPLRLASPTAGSRDSPAAGPGSPSALRCTAPAYVPATLRPPLASPPAKRTPLSTVSMAPQASAVAPPPPPPAVPAPRAPAAAPGLLATALGAMLADVMSKQQEGNAAAFAAAAAMAATTGRGPPPPPPPRAATPPGCSPVPPASPRGGAPQANPTAASSAPKSTAPLTCVLAPPPPPPRQMSPRTSADGRPCVLAPVPAVAPAHATTAATNASEAKKAVTDLLAGLLGPMPQVGVRAQPPKPAAQAAQSVQPAAAGSQVEAAGGPEAGALRPMGAGSAARPQSGSRAPLYAAGVATGAVVVAVRSGPGSAAEDSDGKPVVGKQAGSYVVANASMASAASVERVDAIEQQGQVLPVAAAPALRQTLSDGGVWSSPPTLSEPESGEEYEEEEGEEGAVGEDGDAPRRRRKRGTRTRGRGGRPRRTSGSEAGSARNSTGGGCMPAGSGPGVGAGMGMARAPAIVPRPPQRSAPGDSDSWAVASADAAADGEAKRVGRRDYAAWAAATPEYRAEASAKAAAVAAAMTHSGPSPGQSPPRPVRAPSPADDNWRVGRERSSPGAPAGLVALVPGKHSPIAPGHVETASTHSMMNSRGPDGSRGFAMGRGRPLRPPVFA